jgi:hypothetical protein
VRATRKLKERVILTVGSIHEVRSGLLGTSVSVSASRNHCGDDAFQQTSKGRVSVSGRGLKRHDAASIKCRPDGGRDSPGSLRSHSGRPSVVEPYKMIQMVR